MRKATLEVQSDDEEEQENSSWRSPTRWEEKQDKEDKPFLYILKVLEITARSVTHSEKETW